jgi:YfiH family protein
MDIMDELIWPDIFGGAVKAFFTRRSVGADVDKIRSILSIEKENVFLPVQKHTDNILVLNSDLKPRTADAVITRERGILIGVQVADCVPVLLFDGKRFVAGAVHAGWRGTASGIIKKTIALMGERFGSAAEDIKIALGPSIRRECYDVGREVKDAVCSATGEGGYYKQSSDGKYSVDLPDANILQVVSAGVPAENIWCSVECTFCNPKDFYSFRRHKNLDGRQGGFIGIF